MSQSLLDKLKSDGFEAGGLVRNDKLPEQLIPHLLDLARGFYDDLRIIPLEIVLDGVNGKTKEDPSHVVYVKDNTSHPDYVKNKVRVVTVHMTCPNGPYNKRL
ncbi:MAG: hypothetical protein AABW73_05060 [Nanoarchaeota archaeon]